MTIDYSAVDQAAAAVDNIERQIADILVAKDQATASADRSLYDRCVADLHFLGDRKKLAEGEYQRKRAQHDAAKRAERTAQLAEEREAADRDAALAAVRQKLADAKAHIEAYRALWGEALAVAGECRTHAQRVTELSRELEVTVLSPGVDDSEVDRMFHRLLEDLKWKTRTRRFRNQWPTSSR